MKLKCAKGRGRNMRRWAERGVGVWGVAGSGRVGGGMGAGTLS